MWSRSLTSSSLTGEFQRKIVQLTWIETKIQRWLTKISQILSKYFDNQKD